MSDTITVPRSIFEQIESVIRRLVAQVEPTDKEAKETRNEAVDLMQKVAILTDDEAMQIANEAVRTVHTANKGAQTLLELAQKAEREGWSGPADLAQNHNKYAAKAIADDLKRIHDYYR